jgi:hypothetical protein
MATNFPNSVIMQALQNENFAKVVYIDNATPATSTIFSETTPPTVNDPALKEDSTNIYINPSGQTYIWNGTAYVTYSPTQTTEWYLTGTAIDAQANKNSFVYRNKGIGVGTALTASTSPSFAGALYAGYENFQTNTQHFLFRDSRFPLGDGIGMGLANGGGPGDYYPMLGATPAGTTTSFLIAASTRVSEDWSGSSPLVRFRVARNTGAPLTQRLAFVWQNYTTSIMNLKLDGSVSFGNSVGPATGTAVLDLSATTNKGVLFPRLTTAQITAIASPANGLTVYNTTLNKLCVYELNAWKQVTTTAM